MSIDGDCAYEAKSVSQGGFPLSAVVRTRVGGLWRVRRTTTHVPSLECPYEWTGRGKITTERAIIDGLLVDDDSRFGYWSRNGWLRNEDRF
jgi:hypothetical protein